MTTLNNSIMRKWVFISKDYCTTRNIQETINIANKVILTLTNEEIDYIYNNKYNFPIQLVNVAEIAIHNIAEKILTSTT